MISQAASAATEYEVEDQLDAGCYVAVSPDADSQGQLTEWANKLGFFIGSSKAEQLHCTVMYSKKHKPTLIDTSKDTFTARLIQFEYWTGSDAVGYLVAVLDSRALTERHYQWSDRGARHSFSDYTPHVTLVSGLTCSSALYKRMLRLSDQERGAVLRFNNEIVKSCIV